MSMKKSYKLPIPLLGLPLKGRHNPILVALSSTPLVDVEVEVEESNAPSVSVNGEPRLGWRGELALKSFVDELSARLEQPLRFSVYYQARGFHVAGVYAILTVALVEAVAEEGGYEMEPVEVAEAADSIDWDAGVELDYIDACRRAIVLESSIIFRKGEEPIKVSLAGGKVELVGEEELGDVIEEELGEEIHTALSRLVGLSVAVWSRGIVEKGWEAIRSIWRLASRLENGLYYALFGVAPPPEGCKWTPGLQTAFGVCIDVGEGQTIDVA
ncbi:hypothetical protein [Pyrolobus fumarii]|uniref:hypothetical protein n=1 Tax=Pyrolobus fumarii TaxID=54252 RepID=UPI00064FFC83|nr:hypothetical protein [Pyrolobus fumarii]